MADSADSFAEFNRLIDEQRPREVFSAFLDHVKGKDWAALSDIELRMLDLVCRKVLPDLLEQHTLWMVNHPGQLRAMLELLMGALRAGYRRPSTLDQIAWIRCLLAIGEAIAGRPERAHEELCLLRDEPAGDATPQPNGTFREQIKGLVPGEGSTVPYLTTFFDAYVAFLRRWGQHEVANQLECRIGRLLGMIARDETRPGVVQALLYDVRDKSGQARFVHVALERNSDVGNGLPQDEGILYAGGSRDTIDPAMQEAAIYARQAVDAHLKREGYSVHSKASSLTGKPSASRLTASFESDSLTAQQEPFNLLRPLRRQHPSNSPALRHPSIDPAACTVQRSTALSKPCSSNAWAMLRRRGQ